MEIYNKYSTENDPNFAVLYQPANIDILGFPIEALKYTCPRCITIVLNVLTWILFSNIDYFHPSKITHQWIAKVGYHYNRCQCSWKTQSSPIHASSHQSILQRLWGDLFVPSANKTGTWEFDANQSVSSEWLILVANGFSHEVVYVDLLSYRR